MKLQAQATGAASNQPLVPQTTSFQPLTAQPTGFTSALNRMQSSATAAPVENQELHIPPIRLSFITAKDQDRFEHIFRAYVPVGETAIEGSAARDILMKSHLTASKLADIWSLADTTKSGKLLFPEFCVALHLCNLAIKGENVPYELPLKMQNEVTSFVDAISFSAKNNHTIPDSTPFSEEARRQQALRAQTTGYQQQQYQQLQSQQTSALQPQRTGAFVPLTAQQTAGLVPVNQQRTGGLAPQATGFQPLNQQRTGGLIPQRTGLMPQQTGLMPQQTGLMPQQTGLLPQQTGLMPQPTGLVPMPTGKPGQWGFVSMPTGGLPGLDMMQSHFMPNASSQAQQLTSTMGGTAASNVAWAIAKQEKLIYDNIFKKWDTSRQGYVDGEVAISVFGKSGLARSDLEKIWTLADLGNRGKLNKDEFAVAMHLIYRRLNGFDIPSFLPPELVPPSSKMLQDSMNDLKSQLKNDSTFKPVQRTYTSSDGARYKNNDDDVGYVSKSRHRNNNSSNFKNSADLSENSSSMPTSMRIKHTKKF
ncbi:unnamed protein product [[Candida] boidinii]|uniref:Actin cytoskeleton-regulatory complex protein PAN1 n=1 Tax=Candida boidinii TaxID=5477 RepID=A0A9W6T5F0_CANBO|nr:unnamed protein product [[Candida] boidinii]